MNQILFRSAALALTVGALAMPGRAQATRDIVDVLANDPNFSTLVTAIQTVDAAGIVPGGLVATLKSAGPFTVFAPDNAAFAALPAGVLPSLLANPAELADILFYHVLPAQVPAATVLQGGKTKTLLEKKVQFKVIGPDAFVNSSKILTVDKFVKNGVIHSIDAVLLPSDAPSTIMDVLDESAQFSLLTAAIDIAGLRTTLDTGGPFTLLAPPNGAFLSLPQGALRGLITNPAALANVLKFHVIPGSFRATQVVTLSTAPTVQGNTIFVNPAAGALYLDEAEVIQADVQASNGIIHVLDDVLDPAPTTVVEFLAANPSFSTLVTAVGAANLGATLSGTGPFTVFAPTNRAFNKLPAGALAGLLANPTQLGNVLKYHVVPAKLFAADVIQLNNAATVLGPVVSFSQAANGAVFVNQSQIQAVDIELSNGVIHFIDTVLTVPGP
jgi:uncharacterized surface protein with fasciclin (FAS1) repeats